MIELTRLNGKLLAVNADLIKFVEQAPDTVLTLVTGEKLVVKESSARVMELIVGFRRALLSPLTGATTNGPAATVSPASGPDREV
jgi:flagellar protein FlbD